MNAAVIVYNGRNPEGTAAAAQMLGQVIAQMTTTDPLRVVVPVGMPYEEREKLWPGALFYEAATVAQAVDEAIRACAAEVVHVFQSDVLISPNWPSIASHARMTWPAFGPCGPQLTGSQFVQVSEQAQRGGFASCCEFLAGQYAGKMGRADWLDPECFAVVREKFERLGGLDAEIDDLGFALRDFCLRVRDAGQRVVACASVYCAILDRQRVHPWRGGGERRAAARLAYYRKHAPRTSEQRLVCSWLVQPGNRHQLGLLRQSLRSVQGRTDLVHVALVGHPKGFGAGDHAIPFGADSMLAAVAKCADDPSGTAKACALFARWVAKETGLAPDLVRVDFVPPGWPSLQVLETQVDRLCQDTGAAWCLRLTEPDTLDEGVTLKILRRLMTHPDPMVCGYNVGISFAWDSLGMVREDPPFGDGGTLQGNQDGTNDWRLYRLGASRWATDGGRVANIRLLNVGLVDADVRAPGLIQEGMRCSRLVPRRAIGLAMMTHPGDDPEDLARWLDWTHGLTDDATVLWTSEPTTPNTRRELAFQFGAGWDTARARARPDFAAWRNRSLELLALVDWAWLVDPDEWVAHPVHDLIPVRRMADTDTRQAYLFEFDNYREGGLISESSAVRMVRTGAGLRMTGRVHESFGDGLAKLVAEHGDRAIGRAPFRTHNLATVDHDTGAAKLDLYHQLCREELAENPRSAQHWIVLAHQYAAEGHELQARNCLDNAIACSSPTAYLAHFERGMLGLRRARHDLAAALQRLPQDHHHHQQAAEVLRSLQGVADPIGAVPTAEPDPLPAFPGA